MPERGKDIIRKLNIAWISRKYLFHGYKADFDICDRICTPKATGVRMLHLKRLLLRQQTLSVTTYFLEALPFLAKNHKFSEQLADIH